MKRREFLQTSLAASCAATCLAGNAAADDSTGAQREYYEWRTYRLADTAQQPLVSSYLENACLPAWQRMGLSPVGAFTEIGDDAGPSVHVLLTYPTLAALATARTALEKDTQYQHAAAEYLAVKPAAPAFQRIESSLMVAFAGAPKIQAPARKPRVLELRTYESHGEERARVKVNMFNNGEIPLFPKCGFENVFFSESLIGPALPNLKYMLASPDMAANAASWEKFLADPGFMAMKDDPQYADTVSKITRLYLAPTAYSQI